MSTTTTDSINITEVTDVTEIPSLASLCDLTLRPDPFHSFLERYSGRSCYDDTVEKLSDAVEDPGSKVFKAIKISMDEEGKAVEELVGLSQWYVGYLVVPKVDPFGPKRDVAEQRTPMSELMRKSGNVYVGAIRGKRHVYLRRIIVHPDRQRQGIGQRLLQWGLDVADEQKIVTWLFSRPAGAKMYDRAGFKVVASMEVEADDMVVPPMVGMLRQPKPLHEA